MPKLVDHQARRRQIAEALLEIASTRGLQAATMREVAAQAGVSLRLVQYYFTSKDELLAGALTHLTERLTERIRERAGIADDPDRDPRQVVAGTLSAVLPADEDGRRLVLTYHAYYMFALSEQRPIIERGAVDAARIEGFLAEQLRRAQRQGRAPADLDPEQTAAGLLAIANGLGISVLTGRRTGEEAEHVLSYHLDRLFGVAPLRHLES